MPQASTMAAVLKDEPKETEEMDNQELLNLLRADMTAAEARTEKRFDELKAEIKEVKQELKAEIKEVRQEVAAVEQRVTAYVDKRIDDLREYIAAGRLIKNNWRTFLVAALATAAVLGTFILQLLEAIR